MLIRLSQIVFSCFLFTTFLSTSFAQVKQPQEPIDAVKSLISLIETKQASLSLSARKNLSRALASANYAFADSFSRSSDETLLGLSNALLLKMEQDYDALSDDRKGRVIRSVNRALKLMSRGESNAAYIIDGRLRYWRGQLEVKDNTGWKMVCRDGFDEPEGEIACRQLGGAFRSISNTGGDSTEDLRYSNYSCNGNEDGIMACSFDIVSLSDCGNFRGVHLLCDGDLEHGAEAGGARLAGTDKILQIQGRDQKWYEVCSTSFEAKDAEVACRQLGGKYVDHKVNKDAVSSGSIFGMSGLNCLGSETSLHQCKQSARVACSGINRGAISLNCSGI